MKSPEIFLLTPRQKMVWLHSQINTGIPVEQPTLLCTIEGTVDIARFQRAFNQLVVRHECLRAIIELQNGDLYYHATDLLKEIEFVDFSDAPLKSNSLEAWLEQHSARDYGLDEPLYHATLIRSKPDQFVFYFNQHHVVTDATTTILLIQDLERLYRDESELIVTSLPVPLFSTFLRDTESWANSLEAQEAATYWKNKFLNPPPTLTLYGKSNAPNQFKLRKSRRPISKEMCLHLNSLGPLTPPAMVLTTVFFAFLRRVSNETDICVGVAHHNRPEEMAQSTGLFMQVVPHRIGFDKNETFQSLLRKIRMETSDVMQHRQQAVSRRMANYNVMFNFRPSHPVTFADHPITWRPTSPLFFTQPNSNSRGQPSKAIIGDSLVVSVHQADDQGNLVLELDFNESLLPDPIRREWAIDHFLSLLSAFLSDKKQRIDDIDLLTNEERRRLLSTEESLKQAGEAPPTLSQMFEEAVGRRPNHTAVVFGELSLTYKMLDHRVRLLSFDLLRRGVSPQSIVGICLSRSLDMVVVLLAVLRTGASYVPIDPTFPSTRIDLILDDSEPDLVLGQAATLKGLVGRNQERAFYVDEFDWLEGPLDNSELKPSDRAYIIYTSGSTGRPKGVEVSHHGLSTLLLAMQEEPGLTENDRLLAVTTISFDIAALEIFLPLVTRATVIIAPELTAGNGPALRSMIEEEQISILQATPSTFRILIASGWTGKPDLKILCGGEALPEDLSRQLVTKVESVWNLYGPTETTIWSTVKQLQRNMEVVTIGGPIRGTRVYALNHCRVPTPLGVEGELYISGNGLALGYLGQPKLTSQKFVQDPFSPVPGAKMYRTGDRARFRSDGDLEYLGRTDFQVKIRGHRIELQEIESHISSHEGVTQCVVSTTENKAKETLLVAYIIPTDLNKSPEREEIVNHLRNELPAYMIPAQVISLDSFPLTPNNKVDRLALPVPTSVSTSGLQQSGIKPETHLEVTLATVWEQVLDIQNVTTDANFFDIGGTSLLTIVTSMEMEKATGIPFDITVLFLTPTIAGLIKSIEVVDGKLEGAMVPLNQNITGTPLYCIHGINLFKRLADLVSDHTPVVGVYISDEKRLLDQAHLGHRVEVPMAQMVEGYYRSICNHQPKGPYRLAGLSFGGVLALQVGQALQASGEKVEYVYMFDTCLPSARKHLWLKSFELHVRNLFRREGSHYWQNLFNKLPSRIRVSTKAMESDENLNTDQVRNVFRQGLKRAIGQYEKTAVGYDGNVILFRALDEMENNSCVQFEESYGWNKIVKGTLEIHDVEGDHISMIKEENCSAIAKVVIEKSLTEVLPLE